MRSTSLARIVVGLAWGLLPATAFAQASITGTVKDTSGAVLPGVTVEASSPALIEKVRSAVTDGTGQYRVVDLRPGVYSVKFTLSGFKALERNGVELTGSFTALVNAELSIGALEETITVAGEAPIVDVQSATKEANLTSQVIDSIPTSRMTHTLAVLLPGVSTAGGIQMMPGQQDVGGDRGGTAMNLSVHGSRGGDTLTRISGNALTVGGTATTPINMAAVQEVNVETAALSIEEPFGGVRTSLIPRDGGNAYSGSFYGSYAADWLQGDNYTAELKSRGLLAPNGIKTEYDVNPAFGGPLARDKVWFFTSMRALTVDRYQTALPFNRNAYLAYDDPRGFTYAPDPSLGKPWTHNLWLDGTARVTWQVAPKHKLAIAVSDQYSHNPNSWTGSFSANQQLTISPENALNNYRPLYAYATADWTSPLTSRLLVEHHFFWWKFQGGFYQIENPPQDSRVIGVNDPGLGVMYRAWNTGGSTELGPQRDIRWRTNVTYAPGAHQYQVGFQFSNANNRGWTPLWNGLQYQFNNGVPTRILLNAAPTRNWSDKDAELGVYAGDRWTLGRLTLSGGVRFDYLKSSFPETPQPPGVLFPDRNVTLPASPNVNWKDITYRMAAVHNVFGDGKTAVRVSLAKYLGLSTGLSNPNAFVSTAFRAWTDNGANGGVAGDYVPQCNVLALPLNGECGALSNANFGRVVPGTAVDPALRDGWGKRFYNWEFTAGVQREITRGLSVDVGYFRRWYGNFTVTTNLATGPTDFDYFSVNAPVDGRLPDGGGYPVSGFVNLKPTSFGRASNNFVTFADNYGNQIEHYNGVDVNVNARLASVQLMGGVSTGRTSTDSCAIFAARPDQQVPSTGVLIPSDYCHVDSNFLTQVKGFANYTLPKTEIQLSAAFQSLAGPQLILQYTATNAEIAPSLGRPLTGGTSTTLQMIQPSAYFGDHLYQLDVRLARSFRLRNMRLTPGVDIYNLLNGNAVQEESPAYSTWRQPLTINQARFAKIGVNIAF